MYILSFALFLGGGYLSAHPEAVPELLSFFDRQKDESPEEEPSPVSLTNSTTDWGKLQWEIAAAGLPRGRQLCVEGIPESPEEEPSPDGEDAADPAEPDQAPDDPDAPAESDEPAGEDAPEGEGSSLPVFSSSTRVWHQTVPPLSV